LVRDAVRPLETGSTGEPLDALGDSLLRLGAAPLEQRHPVLFYGSNAAPAQLARKYANSSAGFVVPAVLGVVDGVDAVYSSHVSPYGAVPATLIASPGTSLSVHVGLLHGEQVGVLDQTEPNYRRRMLSGRDYPASLTRGVALSAYTAYLSRHGVLLLDGAPRRVAGVRADGSKLEAATEEAILEEVVRLWNRDHPGEPLAGTNGYLKAIRSGTLRPADVTSWLKRGHAAPGAALRTLSQRIAPDGSISFRRGRGDVRGP
ncbi:MAG TPA: hypothetical protein VGK51_05910, partial [Actinomycetota bacterium]